MASGPLTRSQPNLHHGNFCTELSSFNFISKFNPVNSETLLFRLPAEIYLIILEQVRMLEKRRSPLVNKANDSTNTDLGQEGPRKPL